MPDNPILIPSQFVLNQVADFIYPPGNIDNSKQGYPKHQAEQIRAGKENGNELVQLCARVALEAREEAAKIADEYSTARWRASKGAKTAGRNGEARDFESMSIEGVQIAAAIRNSTKGQDHG